jgi:hypothetical protein
VLLTGVVAYTRTGSPQPFNESFTTNTALAISIFTLLKGAIGLARNGSASTTAVGLGLSYISLCTLSFLRLRGGQSYGAEIGLLACLVITLIQLLWDRERDWNPVPEMYSVAIYGVVVFASQFGVWPPVAIFLGLFSLAFCSDLYKYLNRVD